MDGNNRKTQRTGSVYLRLEGRKITRSNIQAGISKRLLQHPAFRTKGSFEAAISENKLFFDLLLEGVVIFNRNFEATYTNNASALILGLSEAQIKERSAWDPRWKTVREDYSIFPAEDHPSVHTLSTGVPHKDVIMGVIKENAAISWISINTQAIFIKGIKTPEYVLCTFVDITEQKKADQELRESERIQRLVLSSTNSAFVLLNIEDRVILHNSLAGDYYKETTGESELKSKYYPDCVFAGLKRTIEDILKSVKNGEEYENECQITPLGRDKWFQVIFRPVQDEQQKVIGVYNIIKDITSKKSNAEELQKTNLRFRAIFDATYQFMAILSAKGKIEEVNESYTSFTGIDPAELKEKLIWNTTTWGDTTKNKASIREDIIKARKGILVMREAEITTGDTKILVQFSIKPMIDDAGNCKNLILAGWPVDEQRKLEKRLLEKELQFSSFMNNSPMAAWIIDEFNVLRYMNPTCFGSFGLPENSVGQSIVSIFPQYITEEYIQNNQKVFSSKLPLETREQALDKHGNLRTQHVVKFPLGADQNGVRLMGGVAMDITQLITTKGQLRSLNERYEFARKATSDAIWDWDIKKNEIILGEASNKLFGCSSLTISMDIRISHIHPEDRDKYLRSIKARLNGKKEIWKLEYRFRNTSGKYRLISDKAYIIRDSDGYAIRMIGAMQDITGTKRMEKQLLAGVIKSKREMVKAIISAQETERKEISNELHDNVCQILATCKLYIDFSMKQENNGEMLKVCQDMLGSAIDEIRALSHNLTPAAFEEKGLFPAISELVEKLNQLEKIQIKLVVPAIEMERGLSPDAKTALFRIVQEQLNNTLKHSRASKCSVIFSTGKDHLNLSIGDNGVGYDATKVKKGLGMNNITSRVSMLNGEIHFHSSPGKGCKMSLSIPLSHLPA